MFTPTTGPGAALYADVASVHVTPYASLTLPRSPMQLVKHLHRFLVDTIRFVRLFRTHDIDCVISATTYTPAAYIASRLLRLRTIVHCGELLSTPVEPRWQKTMAGVVLRSLIVRTADVVICCSNHAKRQFVQGRRAAIVTLYPAIRMPARLRSPKAVKRGYDIPANAYLISQVGQITPGRGQDMAITALSRLTGKERHVMLALAGEPGRQDADHEFAQSLVRLTQELNLSSRVLFLGHVDPIADLLATSSIVINPCRTAEAFGRVIFEGLAVGVPAVVARTGALEELLSDDTALFIPPNDPGSLATAIARLYHEPHIGNRLVERARPILKLLDQRTNDQQFMQLIS